MIKSTTPIFKRKGKINFIKTVMGIEFNPLNILPEHIDVRDICHVLSRMFVIGGHTRLNYTLAEISVHTHDYLLESYNEIVEVAEKNIDAVSFEKLQCVPLKNIRWLCLLHHAPLAYINSLQLSEFVRDVHYYRILTSILRALCIDTRNYKEGLLLVKVAETLLLREYENSMFHVKDKDFKLDDGEKAWGTLYKRLSKDEVLFKSDGSIRYF